MAEGGVDECVGLGCFSVMLLATTEDVDLYAEDCDNGFWGGEGCGAGGEVAAQDGYGIGLGGYGLGFGGIG